MALLSGSGESSMTRIVYSVGFNSDNPNEARIIEAIEKSQAEHGRAGVRKIMVEAFSALLNRNDDARRLLDRQDEILRLVAELKRSGIAINNDEETGAGVGGLDPEFAKNLIGTFKPGRKR